MRAVIEDDGGFLIAHTKGAGNVYLPGGHVEAGEGMKHALARELAEELAITVEIGEYLGALEHSWKIAGVESHEINHCFEVTSPDLLSSRTPESREDHLEFFWLLPSEFEARNLQPAPLRQMLPDWTSSPGHLGWGSTMERSDR